MQGRRNTRASNESGLNNCGRVSSVRPVSLKILSLLAELAGIDNKAKANRDSCL